MASKDSSRNGHSRLEEALATLIQNQASFVANQRETDRLHAELQRETRADIANIKSQMAEIIRVLNEHTRTMERLTEAVRDRIGFKSQQ
jgi:hypothetical protein